MITCPKCGNKKTHVYSNLPSWNKKHDSFKRYRRCLECGFGFATIEQNENTMADYRQIKNELTSMRSALDLDAINTDYKIGYLSAVSYLEGCVAELERML